MRRVLIGAATACLLAGCATVEVADYRNEKPALDLAQYFDGTIDAWGMFQDRSGKVLKRFHVVIEAKWQGDVGTLDERFAYSDGSTQRRVWTVTKHADGRYTGRADDVVGEAIGEARGNALRWRYTMALPVDGTVYNVAFDDWMFLMDDKTMLNRSWMTKFGIELGQVTLSFRKR
ncbi:DUF3833 domain-containing protein [Niveibacterium umoris]|uniref:DUF3833 domain-containing protein n=1 Tax=Niveibacterium umoris TaxID=1193620 RepID=A0A840BGK1_9RHOO|nr:DUF3833 domain-containing protein [Niveibacterium umoris]MBB4012681.1 hypothetical protein [Niveibacterium umoris]